jgi:3'-phosphoadenosine 5'-phosphosulfate sulfotransferase (PAPS reductase)/FAD synthetase
MRVNYQDYDLVIINTSGGKDSICAIHQVVKEADSQGYPREKIVLSHQDLGSIEWKGTSDLVRRQAEYFGLRLEFSKRIDKNGNEEGLLDYVRRRKMWPSSTTRFCTSDYKRGPGATVITRLSKELEGTPRILYVFGFRAAESPSRSKKEVLTINKRWTNTKRTVVEYLPIHDWSTKKVWDTIKENDLPNHWAYSKGMPRLSCIFCIYSPFDALVIAGRENRALLDEYIQVEEEIGHTFKKDLSLKDVRDAIEAGYEPGQKIEDWVM